MEMPDLLLLKQLGQELKLTPFFAFLFFFSLLLLFILARSTSKLNSPPSPPRLPLIGNLHQLGTHPYRSFRALSEKYGPLMLLNLGQVPTLVVSSADMVKEIIKNHDTNFSNRPKTTAADILLYGCQDVGFAPYGEYWREARKICVLELLSPKRVQQFQSVREEVTVSLIERIRRASQSSNDSPINLSEMLIAASNNIVTRCVLGMNFADESGYSRFGELSRKLMVYMMAFSVGDYFPSLRWIDYLTGLLGRLRKIFRELDTFFDEVVEEHKTVLEDGDDDVGGSKMKDFVDILLGLQKKGMLDFELTKDNMKAILLDMFIGGSDTTSTALEWVMAELVRHPTVLKKAQEEVRRVMGKRSKINTNDINKMDYLKCVIKESLRLHPPQPLIPRETSASIDMGGFHIPAKTRVFINTWAVQRDQNVWDKPEEFLPERFQESSNSLVDFKGNDFQFIPFGLGRRGCPGWTFGVVSTEYVISNLLYWFDWKLPGDNGATMLPKDLDMSEVYGLNVTKKSPLNLVPIPYSP